MKRQTNSSIKAHLLRGVFYLLLVLTVCVIPFALAQRGIGKRSMVPRGTCPTPWTFIADMPIDSYGAGCATDGTFIYCAGGYSFSFPGLVPQLIRYDPGTNTWTQLAPIPVPSAMASAVYYPPTNKIYVFGGSDPDAATVNNLNQIYDVASNTWSTGTLLPDVRAFMASGYNPDNGKIYLVGGYNTAFVDSGQPNTWEYDPVADTYTNKTDFPELAGGYASGIINGHLYVAGGRDANNVSLNAVWDYDITADTWTQRADEPAFYQNNVSGSAVALNLLWVFGGGNPFLAPGPGVTEAAAKAAFPARFIKRMKNRPRIPDTDNQTRFYDPSTDTWGSFSSMNAFRAFTSGTAIGTNVYAAGGYDGTINFTLASAETMAACVPTPTPPQCDTGAIQNEGFETADFPPWVILNQDNVPVVTNTLSHTGTFSAFVGDSVDGFCGFPGVENPGDSSFYQEFTVPAGTSTLTFWHWDCTTDSITFDWQDAYITDTNGTILQTLFHQCLDGETWINTNVDMTPYAGQTVRVEFLVHLDNFGDLTGMYVDDVQLTVPCGSPTPTPTPTATPTPRPSPTPRARPTPHPRPTP